MQIADGASVRERRKMSVTVMSLPDYCQSYVAVAHSKGAPADLVSALGSHATYVVDKFTDGHGSGFGGEAAARAAEGHKRGLRDVLMNYLFMNREALEGEAARDATMEWYGACTDMYTMTSVGAYYAPAAAARGAHSTTAGGVSITPIAEDEPAEADAEA
jgi:hypothetical protein